MATYDQNINQFKQGKAVGDLDLNFFGGENVISCRYNPSDTSTNRLVAGETVTLADLGASETAGIPVVTKRGADTTAIFGCVKRSLKKAEFKPDDIVEIAVFGAVMNLRASAALNRGVKVSGIYGTPGSIQAVSTKAYLGYTLDHAAASGDIIRVMIQADAVTAGS
jgi:hypothetical protein